MGRGLRLEQGIVGEGFPGLLGHRERREIGQPRQFQAGIGQEGGDLGQLAAVGSGDDDPHERDDTSRSGRLSNKKYVSA